MRIAKLLSLMVGTLLLGTTLAQADDGKAIGVAPSNPTARPTIAPVDATVPAGNAALFAGVNPHSAGLKQMRRGSAITFTLPHKWRSNEVS